MSSIFEMIDAVDVDAVLLKVLSVSSKNQTKYENDIRIKEKISITLAEYIALIRAGYVVKSIKTNRPDVNKLEKKQGIVETLFSGDDLPNLCVSVYYDDEGNVQIRVTDGGHRTRSFDEFINNEFSLSPLAFYMNDFGRETTLNGMSAQDIFDTHPRAWRSFMNEELTFTVYHNSTPNQDARETQNRNKGSNHNAQEQRNTLDDNVVAEWVRNTARPVEEENNTPHRLFIDKHIGFTGTRLKYDEALTRLLLMVEKKDPSVEIDNNLMDEFFQNGSIYDRGYWFVKEKEFNALIKDTSAMLDTIANIYDYYPKGMKLDGVKLGAGTFTALTRFLLSIESELMIDQQKAEIVDYKKFADSFAKMLQAIVTDKTLKDWINSGKDEFTKGSAFKKYLGQFHVVKKTNWTIRWMLDEFANRYEDFGMIRIDRRASFRPQDILERYISVGKICEACKTEVEQKDVQGDHDIPRSWGVDAGGVTEKENLRILCAPCNNKKSNKYTFEEFAKQQVL